MFRNMCSRAILVCGVIVWLLAHTTHSGPDQRKAPGEGFNLLSEKEEIDLGRASAAQVEKEVVLLNDAQTVRFVEHLGQALVGQSQRNNIPYTFKVVNTDDINAFALPGGFIYLHRGVLDRVDREEEVAGVMAHEISHVVARHSAKQASKFMMVGLGMSVLDTLFGHRESAAKNITEIATAFVAQGAFLKFSRDAEREADQLGVQNMYDAGFNPRGMMTFFEKLREVQKSEPSKVEQFFATHPSVNERIENVSKEIGSFPPKRWIQVDRDFALFKTNLKRLPPAPPKKDQGRR